MTIILVVCHFSLHSEDVHYLKYYLFILVVNNLEVLVEDISMHAKVYKTTFKKMKH